MFFSSSFKKNIIMESQHTDEDVSFMIFNSCPHNIVLEEYSKKNKYIFKPEHYVIGKINKNFKSFNTYIANKRYCTHYLLFKDKIFEELINEKTNQNAIFKVNGFVINQEKTIDTKQQLILDNLPTILSLEGKLQELYLESKIIDLIYITINDIKKSTSKENYKLGSKDIECLYNAKDILIKNFKNPPSLKMLAHQAAINEYSTQNVKTIFYKI